MHSIALYRSMCACPCVHISVQEYALMCVFKRVCVYVYVCGSDFPVYNFVNYYDSHLIL